MAYTPSSDFTLTGSPYTPSPDFDLSEQQAPVTYDNLFFSQSWAIEIQENTTSDSLAFNQKWAIEIPIVVHETFSQQWALNAYSDRGEVAFDQSWALDAPVIVARVWSHQWNLVAASTRADAVFSQSYVLSAPGIANHFWNHRWRLSAPDVGSDLRFSQDWALESRAIWSRVVSAVTYRLTLTDSADQTTDVELPMSSFQSRLRSGNAGFLQVVVPNARAYADVIGERANGSLIIERGIRYSDGAVHVSEIVRAALSQMSVDLGAKRSSVSLQGTSDFTNSSPKTVVLSGIAYKASSGGRRRVRCSIDNSLRPGDTASADGETFVVDEVQHLVSTTGAYMELSEVSHG